MTETQLMVALEAFVARDAVRMLDSAPLPRIVSDKEVFAAALGEIRRLQAERDCAVDDAKRLRKGLKKLRRELCDTQVHLGTLAGQLAEVAGMVAGLKLSQEGK